MARSKLRKQRDVVAQAGELAASIRAALDLPTDEAAVPELIDTLWQAEGLGMLEWALGLVEMPPYDQPFDAERVVSTPLDDALLRPVEEVETARDAARLWHWRGRTATLMEMAGGGLPERWRSFEQLVAATAMRGHEQGLLPRPLRGDFPPRPPAGDRA